MIHVLPLDFLGQGALLEPKDRKLHDMAVEYAARELQGGKDLDLTKFTKCWVVVDVQDGEYKEVVGLTGWVWRIDIPVFRVSGRHVDYTTQALMNRLQAYFEDNGARGTEVFLHISSKELPEQRCEDWESSLRLARAVPADRYSVKV